MTFYEFCKLNKEKLKNSRWSAKQAAYINFMKKNKEKEDKGA